MDRFDLWDQEGEHYVCVRADAAAAEEWRKAAREYAHFYAPREQYARTFVLLPQLDNEYDAADWRQAAGIAGARHMHTMGHSPDDAGIGPWVRRIIAVNVWENYPQGALQDFFREYYPDASYEEIDARSPTDMAIQLLDPLDGADIAQGQSWDKWKDMRFGEDAATKIGQYGCFLTGLSIALRTVYERDVTPPILDRLLVAARVAYFNDNLLDWRGACSLFGAFGETVKANHQHSADDLTALLNNGWEVILYRAVPSPHFVYLEDVTIGGDLLVIDTWDGQRKQHPPSRYAGIRAVEAPAYA